jgi:phosphatidylglycerophosphatase A
MVNRLAILLATGFGLGYAPVASGTFGALLGIPLVYLIHTCPSLLGQIVSCATFALLAVPICDAAEKQFGKKDDGRVVADEWMLLPLVFIGIPLSPLMVAVGFVISRIFDIIKPWPARGLQRVKGGLGIVIDDFFAAFYSLAFNHLAYWALTRMGWL